MNERLREYHYLMIKNFAEDEILQNQTRHKIQDMKWIPYKDLKDDTIHHPTATLPHSFIPWISKCCDFLLGHRPS